MIKLDKQVNEIFSKLEKSPNNKKEIGEVKKEIMELINSIDDEDAKQMAELVKREEMMIQTYNEKLSHFQSIIDQKSSIITSLQKAIER